MYNITVYTHTRPLHPPHTVPMDVAEPVDGVDSQNHFTGVELGHILREVVLILADECENVTTEVVVHGQVLEGRSKKYENIM